MLVNKYISDVLKTRLEEAIKSETNSQADSENICSRYHCTMVFQPKKEQPKTDPTKHYFIRTFDNQLTDNGKGYEYINKTKAEKQRTQRNHNTGTRVHQTNQEKHKTQRNHN